MQKSRLCILTVLFLEELIWVAFEISHIKTPFLLRLFTAVQLKNELNQDYPGWWKLPETRFCLLICTAATQKIALVQLRRDKDYWCQLCCHKKSCFCLLVNLSDCILIAIFQIDNKLSVIVCVKSVVIIVITFC